MEKRMRAHMSTYSAMTLAAATWVLLGACGPADRGAEAGGDAAAGAGGAVDTVGGAVGTVGGGTSGGDTAAGGTTGGRTMSAPEIVGQVNAVNAMEVQAAALAQKNAQAAQVKSFARQLNKDHKAMEEQMRELAGQLKITSPAVLDSSLIHKQHEALTDLQGKSGAEFDRAFVQQQLQAHEQALALVSSAIMAAESQQLKQALEQARTKIQAHLETVRKLEGQIKA